ncbi:GNAT family N-acetyltransferase [Furfurilactobacillus sp. WILCCON 0119]|uniref:GNAT family N-acetyltransferase n=1 Tax=Furfurilactobacillus entadae TaxID=2922307 RepID=UPI0035E7962F
MAIKIKRVTVNDVHALQEISINTFKATFAADNAQENLQHYLATAYNQTKLIDEINNDQSEFDFIFYNERLAGYLKLNWLAAQTEPQGEDHLEVERIYIKQEFHRLGLGKHLINHAVSKAHSLGMTSLWLGVWEHNQNALAFYKTLGFVPFSDHTFDFGGDLQRDILMEKALPALS